MAELPTRAEIVVVGGGVVGASVAYHLTKLGYTDVLLIEQGRLSSGTTWHAAGLVGQLRASESGTRLVQYSGELYDELEAETGLTAGYRQCGGVTVARTEDRMIQLNRTAASAAAYNLECGPLTPAPALQRYPCLGVDALAAELGDGEPEVHHVACVVPGRQQHARVAVSGPCHRTGVFGRGRGEDVADHGTVGESGSDRSAEGWIVS